MTKPIPYNTLSSTSSLGKKYCHCLPLRICCFILGYLTMFTNVCNTGLLFTLTTYIGADTSTLPALQSSETPLISGIEVVLLMTVINAAWLLVNIACVVGLHRRRPGNIKFYVLFAACRLVLVFAGLVYLTITVRSPALMLHRLDIVVASFFIMVYNTYARQLENEKQQIQARPENQIRDVSFIDPRTMDDKKLILT
ncbi:uncharacterized protein LOC101737570 isoform X2 [Bombyx mori]|uniref:Uncharacterized protein n=1 Tax=Bombyx mori TaxID=7091 RepID=A0A8R1WFD3_BOMMO|nr:uncharacterized protein LOC101737570 isoform X2 [Bombyx mori]